MRTTSTRRSRTLGHCFAVVAVIATIAVAGLANAAGAAGLANPAIYSQASASGFPVGLPILDSATLGLGNNPTGSITFALYGPSDPTCAAAPLSVSSTPVWGNGYYSSASFVTLLAGTYRWTAAYSGDANNNPTAPTTCAAPASAVSVAKATLSFSAAASPVSISGSITDTATLSNGFGLGGPGGSVTFALYGPNDLTCAAAPVFTSTKWVAGNGAYTSDPVTPTASGTYQWVVNYTGDANNWWAGTICTDPANAVLVVAGPGASLTLTTSPSVVSRGSLLTVTWATIATPSSGDWMALYALGAPDSAVVAWRYTGGRASGSTTLTVPWGAAPGSYEVRLFAHSSYVRLATSAVVTVS